MKPEGRFNELISRRYNFVGAYATVALTYGLCDLFWGLFGGPSLLVNVLASVLSTVKGSVTASSGGLSAFGIAITLVGFAPLFLVYLALMRGRRVGRNYLVFLPLLSIVITLASYTPWGLAFGLGSALPRFIAWCLHGLCLYYGMRRTAEFHQS